MCSGTLGPSFPWGMCKDMGHVGHAWGRVGVRSRCCSALRPGCTKTVKKWCFCENGRKTCFLELHNRVVSSDPNHIHSCAVMPLSRHCELGTWGAFLPTVFTKHCFQAKTGQGATQFSDQPNQGQKSAAISKPHPRPDVGARRLHSLLEAARSSGVVVPATVTVAAVACVPTVQSRQVP